MKKTLFLYLLSLIIGFASVYLLPQAIRYGLDMADKIMMIAGMCTSATLATIAVYIDYKEKQSKRIRRSAAAKDYVWNFEQMKLKARAAFYGVDTACKTNNLSYIECYLTKDYYLEIKEKINNGSANEGMYGELDGIDETRIICCKDYLNNEEDKFVAYIKGKMGGKDNMSEEFNAMLYFSRQKNEWLLYDIRSGMLIWNLISSRNVEE